MSQSERGRDMAKSVRNVAIMHEDTQKLFLTYESEFTPPRESVLGGSATTSLSYGLHSGPWMAQGVYRYWRENPEDLDIEAMMVVFYRAWPDLEQPLLLLGTFRYKTNEKGEADVHPWDLWHAYFDWGESQELGTIMHEESPNERIDHYALCARPLYAADSVDTVREWMQAIRDDGG